MKSIEAELAELRERVARLEHRLEHRLSALAGTDALRVDQPLVAPVPPPLPVAGAGTEPPVLASPAASPGLSSSLPGAPAAARPVEINSSVWVAGIGAVIFLVGAFYGLTVAIQRGWISPLVRVGAGMIAGAAVAAWAARLIGGRPRIGVAFLAVGAGLWTFSLYYGSQRADLFPAFYGLAGTVLAVVAGGFVAARAASDGAMGVSLATGLVAPLAFSTGRHEFPALAGYLAGLSAAQFGVHVVARAGEDWRWSRLLGTAGVWFVALIGALSLRHGSAELALGLIGILAGLGLALAWLPTLDETPWAPGGASTITLLGAALLGAFAWKWTDLPDEGYAVVLVALALVSLGLVRIARWRTGTDEYDGRFIVLALAFAAVAAPVAWEGKWVTIAWGVGAVALTWLARPQVTEGRAVWSGLPLGAVLLTGAATLLWAALALDQKAGEALFFNRVFAGAALASAAWGLMVATPGGWRAIGFVAFELVAVNAVAWEFARAVPPIEGQEATLPLGQVLATLTYTLAGAGQWLWGVGAGGTAAGRALRRAGYGCLAAAVGKLFVHDLAGRDLVYRAVAALAVGAIFLGAALWANRRTPPAD